MIKQSLKLAKERAIALELVTIASHLCEKVFDSRIVNKTNSLLLNNATPKSVGNSFQKAKKDTSPVTIADFGVQALINSVISSIFPSDYIIGEESGKDLSSGGPELVQQVLNAVNSTILETKSIWDVDVASNSSKTITFEAQLLIKKALLEIAPLTEDSLIQALDASRYPEQESDSEIESNTKDEIKKKIVDVPAGSRIWTLDPIDGTKGFLRGGQYAVCLGLLINNHVNLGVLGCPNLPFTEAKQHLEIDDSANVNHKIDDAAETARRRALFTAEIEADKEFYNKYVSSDLAHNVNKEINEITGTLLSRGSIFVAVLGQGAYVRRFEPLFGRHSGSNENIDVEEHKIHMRVPIEIISEPNVPDFQLNLESDPVIVTPNENITGHYTPPILDKEQVSLEESVSEMVFVESVESGHSSQDDSQKIAQELGIRASPLRMDSQCKYGTLASGMADIYLRLPVRKDYIEKIWDHAAGSLIVEEAGGIVTDVNGNRLDFSNGSKLINNKGVIVSPTKAVHDKVLETIKKIVKI